MAGLRVMRENIYSNVSGNVNSTEVFLEEGLGLNKCVHIDTSTSPSVPLSSRPTVLPAAFHSGTSTGQDFFFQGMPNVQNKNERPKKKGQK